MRGCYYLYCAHPSTTCIFIIIRVSTLYMMTVHFYNYLAAVEVQPQSVATNLHVRAIALIGAAPLPGQT